MSRDPTSRSSSRPGPDAPAGRAPAARDPTGLRRLQARPPRPQRERAAKTYDGEVYPLVDGRLGELALAAVGAETRGVVLEWGCGAGERVRALVDRHQGPGRVVGLESAPALIERARERLGDVLGKKAFIRPHDPARPLPFAEESFDLVLASGLLTEVPDRAATLAELYRVTAPGGRLTATVLLDGTWAELLDHFAEVLRHLGRREAEDALATYRASMPDGNQVEALIQAAGFAHVEAELTTWELLFGSGREFFFAPVIEQGPLPGWKAIAGRGPAMQEVFLHLKEAIDTYYAGRPFAVSVVAGCFVATKPDISNHPDAGSPTGSSRLGCSVA